MWGLNPMANPFPGSTEPEDVLDANLTWLYDQLDKMGDFLSLIQSKGYDTSRIWFRPRGGTGSQIWTETNWPNAMIDGWASLQATYGIKLIYVVNYNQTTIWNKDLIDLKHSRGMMHSAIEYGNEFYLNKFKTGDVTKPEVTVLTTFPTVASYINATMPKITAFGYLNLPHFIILAPYGKNGVYSGTQANYFQEWNGTIITTINANPSLDLNTTIHIYDTNGLFPFTSLETLYRSKLPQGRKIFVTEWGKVDEETGALPETIDPLDLVFSANQTIELGNNIRNYLVEGDVAFNHQFYNNYNSIGAYNAWYRPITLSEPNGITYRGERMVAEYFPDFENRLFYNTPVSHPGALDDIDTISTFYQIEYLGKEKGFIDIVKPNSAGPYPWVLLIHGGEFITGDKSTIYGTSILNPFIIECVENDIAVISVGYSFVDNNTDTKGIGLKSINDILKAIMLIKSSATNLNIIKDTCAYYGLGSGADVCLLLSCKELGLQTNNYVFSHTSKPLCIVCDKPQATIDFKQWPVTSLTSDTLQDLLDIGINPTNLFGVSSVISPTPPSLLLTNTARHRRRQLDIVPNLQKGEMKPMWAYNTLENANPVTLTEYQRSPKHLLWLKTMFDAQSVECQITGLGVAGAIANDDLTDATPYDFVARFLL
jgi:hypothetical protein